MSSATERSTPATSSRQSSRAPARSKLEGTLLPRSAFALSRVLLSAVGAVDREYPEVGRPRSLSTAEPGRTELKCPKDDAPAGPRAALHTRVHRTRGPGFVLFHRVRRRDL